MNPFCLFKWQLKFLQILFVFFLLILALTFLKLDIVGCIISRELPSIYHQLILNLTFDQLSWLWLVRKNIKFSTIFMFNIFLIPIGPIEIRLKVDISV